MGELNGVDKKQLKEEQDPSTMTVKNSGALLHRMQQPIEHKDFVTEVRGIMDITNLLDRSAVILDLQVKFQTLCHNP